MDLGSPLFNDSQPTRDVIWTLAMDGMGFNATYNILGYIVADSLSGGGKH